MIWVWLTGMGRVIVLQNFKSFLVFLQKNNETLNYFFNFKLKIFNA